MRPSLYARKAEGSLKGVELKGTFMQAETTGPWAHTRTIIVQGQQLRVAIRPGNGTSTPLLLMNGVGADLEVLQPFVNTLDRPLRNNGTETYAKGEWPCQSGGMCQQKRQEEQVLAAEQRMKEHRSSFSTSLRRAFIA
jgi:hypothetical protein